jgi:hypothetical protein
MSFMKLLDLAKTLETTPEDLVKYFKENKDIDIPLDNDYELSYEVAKKANWKLTPEVFESFNKSKEQSIDKDNTDNIGGTNAQTITNTSFEKVNVESEILKEYFSWSEKKLIEEILIHNQIDKLILKGKYIPDSKGRGFGFIVGLTHENGAYLKYPSNFGDIDSAFILSDELKRGQVYIFETQIAKRKNREEKQNPFLIQVNRKSINEVIELSELNTLLEEKKIELVQFEKTKENIQSELDKETTKRLDEADAIVLEKYKKANEIIEEYENTIQTKYIEIKSTEQSINRLNIEISNSEEKIAELLKTKTDMESSIKFLSQKLELCKNLEFISDNEADKYLNYLKSDTIKLPENHLDFINDFDGDLSKLTEHVQLFLYKVKGLIYTRFQIQNFLSLLMTHDIIVLSGLSGSGKTQIIKSFAEALGGVSKIIPVKPNWTSSDDLLGYYNPIQSSFLPTPFTEAISEAIQNPNQLYFICLDEMNLARAEYYFADFLSKLEEREKSPEIELYAKHEEDLFLSEFSTLISLFENAIKDKKIKSWQDFLSDNEARNRFFELLGSMEKESMLKIHSKMKRRLIDILKFPATIKIPSNIRFIGAINVDETTNYFSPKILDRVHIVKFENPLLFESEVASALDDYEYDKELKPIYLHPNNLGERQPLPKLNEEGVESLVSFLKEINKKYLLNLSIDFGVRSIRQAINYASCFKKTCHEGDKNILELTLNTIVNQKILPRFVFDGNETLKNGETKIELLKRFADEMKEKLGLIEGEDNDIYSTGYLSYKYINDLTSYAEINNGQVNFYI